jgi:hypothetical protein
LGFRFQCLLAPFGDDRSNPSCHEVSVTDCFLGTSEPAKAPDFTQRAGVFLEATVRDRMPIDEVQGRMLIDVFKDRFAADLKSFDGDRSIQAVERFVTYLAGIPGLSRLFMGLLPRGQHEKWRTEFTESVRDGCRRLIERQLIAIEKMPEETLAEAASQRTLKVIRDAEALLQR